MSEEEVPTCSVCKMPLYEGCKNASKAGALITVIDPETGETKGKTCPNMKRLMLKRHLESIDAQLVRDGVRHDRNSPLFQPATKDKPLRDHTSKNLLIKRQSWPKFLPHLKWVAACKGTQWFVRVVTDMTLLKVWVGDASIKARRLQKAYLEGTEELLVANNLEDYLSGPDLVIIRLGHVIHFNKAAANVMTEALLLRASLGKPTWLVEPHDRSFIPFQKGEYGAESGMVTCNSEVMSYVEANFTKVNLKTTVNTLEEEEVSYIEDEDEEIGDESPAEPGFTTEGLDIEEAEDDEEEVDEEALGDAVNTDDLWSDDKPTKKKKWSKKR